MTVVVTGATGHLGANLVRALLEAGRPVRALVHSAQDGLEGLDLETVRGDVCDPASLRAAFDGAEVVYHLAAMISISGGHGGRVAAVNVDGARHVAEAALACGVRRLVHCSSVHAFDLTDRSRPVDEDHPRAVSRRNGAYDRSKAAGERAVREVVARGLDAVIVHPSGVIGPHDYRPSRMGRVLVQMYHGRLPALVGGGFDWVDVRDVVDGMLAAERRGRTGASYILSGQWAAVGALARMARSLVGARAPRLVAPMWAARLGAPLMDAFGHLTGREPLYTSESLAALRGNPRISCARAACELGYVPRPLQETLADTYAWFEAHGALGQSPR